VPASVPRPQLVFSKAGDTGRMVIGAQQLPFKATHGWRFDGRVVKRQAIYPGDVCSSRQVLTVTHYECSVWAMEFRRYTTFGEFLERAASTLAPYGPDGRYCYSAKGATIVYCPFHTMKESKSETQPHRSRAGMVLTWDGRLDNRSELKQQLSLKLEGGSPDVLIVASAYEQWGKECLSKLIGDWALSVWTPGDQSLILAKTRLERALSTMRVPMPT